MRLLVIYRSPNPVPAFAKEYMDELRCRNYGGSKVEIIPVNLSFQLPPLRFLKYINYSFLHRVPEVILVT